VVLDTQLHHVIVEMVETEDQAAVVLEEHLHQLLAVQVILHQFHQLKEQMAEITQALHPIMLQQEAVVLVVVLKTNQVVIVV
jgi:hypothetical protein